MVKTSSEIYTEISEKKPLTRLALSSHNETEFSKNLGQRYRGGNSARKNKKLINKYDLPISHWNGRSRKSKLDVSPTEMKTLANKAFGVDDLLLRLGYKSASAKLKMIKKLESCGINVAEFEKAGKLRKLNNIDDDTFIEKAMKSNTWKELHQEIGMKYSAYERDIVWKRYIDLKIETNIFYTIPNFLKISDEEFRNNVAKSNTWSEMAVACRVGPSNLEDIKKKVKEMSLDTSHFRKRGGKKRTDQDMFKKNAKVLPQTLLCYLRKTNRAESCLRCGATARNAQRRINLSLSFKNKDCHDHTFSNLELLCSNCYVPNLEDQNWTTDQVLQKDSGASVEQIKIALYDKGLGSKCVCGMNGSYESRKENGVYFHVLFKNEDESDCRLENLELRCDYCVLSGSPTIGCARVSRHEFRKLAIKNVEKRSLRKILHKNSGKYEILVYGALFSLGFGEECNYCKVSVDEIDGYLKIYRLNSDPNDNSVWNLQLRCNKCMALKN